MKTKQNETTGQKEGGERKEDKKIARDKRGKVRRPHREENRRWKEKIRG